MITPLFDRLLVHLSVAHQLWQSEALCFAAISHLSGTLRKQKFTSTKTYCLWSVINRFWSILFLFFKPVGCFPDHDWRQPKSQWLVWFPIQSFCVSWSGRKHLTNNIKHNWIDNISNTEKMMENNSLCSLWKYCENRMFDIFHKDN